MQGSPLIRFGSTVIRSRAKYGLHPGDEVEVVEVGGTLQVVRAEGAESRGQRLVRRLRNTATGQDVAGMSRLVAGTRNGKSTVYALYDNHVAMSWTRRSTTASTCASASATTHPSPRQQHPSPRPLAASRPYAARSGRVWIAGSQRSHPLKLLD
jgi:hypothetical protein